ncbi:DUF5131 family protein [Aliihoeflea sp. 40Bstr573]|uniref:DUF5131 family protein n=1 Tax=Aliihoeflea sp. 40Bstr573 TaxID=2696467 RepID=UPI002094F99B|nr:phage Gp37/Gp68 family protein [Aliihoeflea sp. 40Bstr573]MCO6386385.1 DUF5131 family protein [Aliihoeflea sp. 40Bstr573]
MAETSLIEWTDATWNPITGCSVVSPGCTNCYAMKLAGSRLRHISSRAGLTVDSKNGPVWNGKVRLNEESLSDPLRWKRPRLIFVCAHGDLFHESVPDAWIDQVFAIMAITPWHTYQVLTKRAGRMRAYFEETWQRPAREGFHIGDLSIPAQPAGIDDRWHQVESAIDALSIPDDARFWTEDGKLLGRPAWPRAPLPNVWLGVSAEDQVRANERIPDLLATPAAVRFLSAEPLIGSINLRRVRISPDHHTIIDALDGYAVADRSGVERSMLDWVIVGGESGANARPMHPDWARSLRDQCRDAGTPFFFKQWGEWETAIDRDRDDADWRADYSRDFIDRGKSRWINLAGGRGFHGERFHVMRRVGKKAAGRLLDGVEHSALPKER